MPRALSADVDEAIEARFYPAPSIRRAEIGTYCVGSPMDTPTGWPRATVQPGQSTHYAAAAAARPVLIRSPQGRGVARVKVADGDGPAGVELAFETTAILPEQAGLSAGDVTDPALEPEHHIS